MEPRELKDRIFAQFARVGKALASPSRLELLELLAQGDRTVEALAREANLSVSNASQHLQVLREGGLVEATKLGLFVTYRLADSSVFELTRALRSVAERHLAELERVVRDHLEALDSLEPVSSRELLRRMRAGTVTVLDVRPPEEYESGHIPGAISAPVSELQRHLAQLPKKKDIVAYCRGPYCLMAYRAVTILRARGVKARRLAGGLPDWRADGLSVVRSEAPRVQADSGALLAMRGPRPTAPGPGRSVTKRPKGAR